MIDDIFLFITQMNVVNRDCKYLNKVSLERTPEVPYRFKIYQKCTTLSTIRNSKSPSVKIIFNTKRTKTNLNHTNNLIFIFYVMYYNVSLYVLPCLLVYVLEL